MIDANPMSFFGGGAWVGFWDNNSVSIEAADRIGRKGEGVPI